MQKTITMGLLLAAASLLIGCQKKTEETQAAAPAAATAPAPRNNLENMVTLSELQKGEVIRGKDISDSHIPAETPTVSAAPAKEPLLSYTKVIGCENGSCPVDNLQSAKSKSETLKGMLQKIPLMHHTASRAESRKDEQLMAGDAGNFNAIKIPAKKLPAVEGKLPGSGHSQLPNKSKGKKDLWPGGIPLAADIDPDISGF